MKGAKDRSRANPDSWLLCGRNKQMDRVLPKSLEAPHLAVATWMITKPLMSGNCELTRSTCSCLGPLLEGVMLNWIKALS